MLVKIVKITFFKIEFPPLKLPKPDSELLPDTKQNLQTPRHLTTPVSENLKTIKFKLSSRFLRGVLGFTTRRGDRIEFAFELSVKCD